MEFRNGTDVQRTRMTCFRLGTVSALDRQTDGQIHHNNIALCMHCMLTHDNSQSDATCKESDALGRSKEVDK